MSSLRVAPFPMTIKQRSSAAQKWKREKKLGGVRGRKKVESWKIEQIKREQERLQVSCEARRVE